MTFIKEITPHIERIRLHKEGGRITSIEILREIRDIHFTHIRSNDFDVPTNLGCGSCVSHMINQLVGRIDRDTIKLEQPIEDIPYIEVKDKQLELPPMAIMSGEKMTFPKQEPLTEQKVVDALADMYKEGNTTIVIDPSTMKWGTFKKYCTSKGLKVPKKTRQMLEEELKAL